MLLRKDESGEWVNMHLARIFALALFSTELRLPDDDRDEGKITVTFRPPDREVQKIEIPLEPEIDGLKEMTVDMHRSATSAYVMPEVYSAWFSGCLGYEVQFVYLGAWRREILGNLMPKNTSASEGEGGGWFSGITKSIPYFGAEEKQEDNKILTFADIAPYLLVSETSLHEVSSRLPEGEEMDVRKFRPNFVIAGAQTAYDEDYWGELTVKSQDGGEEVRFTLTNNCARCTSINVDFDTGLAAEGEKGTVLKKLMVDRRVDPGRKFGPIFGRYGFLTDGKGQEGVVLRVGDEVRVSGRNEERTVFRKLYLLHTVCVDDQGAD